MPSRLQRVVALLRGTGCDHLVRYSERVLTLKGIGLHAPPYSADIGSLGTRVEPLYEAAQMAFILDDCQYILCRSIEEGEISKVEGGRLRTMVILGITHLRAIAARGEATHPLKDIASFLNVSLEEVDEALK